MVLTSQQQGVSIMLKRLLLLSVLFACPAQAGTIVYQNDFESGLPGDAVSGPRDIVDSLGFSSVGFGNNFLQNTSGSFGTNSQIATTITLTNLPDHDSVDFGFLLAIINSWDDLGASFGPDVFQVFIDGTLLFSESFANFSDAQTASTSNRILGPTQLGFGGEATWPETAYDFTNFSAFTNIAHTSDSLILSFITAGAGWEGGTNESFGIDNISISLNGVSAVPEPTIFGIFGLGLLALLRRRVLF